MFRRPEDTLLYRDIRARTPGYARRMMTKLFPAGEPFVITRNRFPYINAPARHMLFWIHPGVAHFYSPTRVRSIVETLYPGAKAYGMFMNDPSVQSVGAIPHYHFFTHTHRRFSLLSSGAQHARNNS